jgi:OOP family OmpA-OmpF porin
VGLALRNLLGQVGNQSEARANQIPADMRFGLAFEFVDGLLLTSDLQAVRDNSGVVLHLGGEFSAPLGNGMNAAARLGINDGRATGGLGFGVGVMSFDYAYVVEEEAFLGQYHLFSLTTRFGVHRQVTRDEGTGDLDQDGFPDAEDACPGDPEDFDGFEDYDGCPDLDNDGDGILDLDDYCPDQPEDLDGFEDADGCPDLDNDGDGILDEADRCPDEAETQNGYQDEDGCPDEMSIAFPPVEISFGPGNAALPPGRNTGLDEVAGIMIRYPEIRIEVQGHTDGQGAEAANLRLSQERANAVKAYLVKRGVDPGRIVATGYGESLPVASNDTPEGRAENRRIVFLVLEP